MPKSSTRGAAITTSGRPSAVSVLEAFAHTLPAPGATVQRPRSPPGTGVAPKFSRLALTGATRSSGWAARLLIVTLGALSVAAGDVPALTPPKYTYARPPCAHWLPRAAAAAGRRALASRRGGAGRGGMRGGGGLRVVGRADHDVRTSAPVHVGHANG